MKFIKLVLITMVAVVVMNALHELGHALMAKLLGYEVFYNINSVSPVAENYREAWHWHAVDLAGPIVTIALALLGARWAVGPGGKATIGAAMVFVGLMMRILATVASMNNPNDESRVSEAMGIGYWTLPAIVIAILAFLMLGVARRRRLGWRFFLGAFIGASFGFAAVVMGEPHLPDLRF